MTQCLLDLESLNLLDLTVIRKVGTKSKSMVFYFHYFNQISIQILGPSLFSKNYISLILYSRFRFKFYTCMKSKMQPNASFPNFSVIRITVFIQTIKVTLSNNISIAFTTVIVKNMANKLICWRVQFSSALLIFVLTLSSLSVRKLKALISALG